MRHEPLLLSLRLVWCKSNPSPGPCSSCSMHWICRSVIQSADTDSCHRQMSSIAATLIPMVWHRVKRTLAFARSSLPHRAIREPTQRMAVQLVTIKRRTRETASATGFLRVRSTRLVLLIYTSLLPKSIPLVSPSSQPMMATPTDIPNSRNFNRPLSRLGLPSAALISATQVLRILHGEFSPSVLRDKEVVIDLDPSQE